MKSVKFFSLLGMTIVIATSFILVGCSQKRSSKTASSSGKRISSLQSVYFDFDKSSIRGNQRSVLNDNAQWLKQNKSKKVRVAGNCDDRGTEEYNIALGQRRANSVRNFLVSSGVSGSRISTISYGEEKGTCSAQTEGCWAKNRRADFNKK